MECGKRPSVEEQLFSVQSFSDIPSAMKQCTCTLGTGGGGYVCVCNTDDSQSGSVCVCV